MQFHLCEDGVGVSCSSYKLVEQCIGLDAGEISGMEEALEILVHGSKDYHDGTSVAWQRPSSLRPPP